jgi:hypothetical protein
METNHQKKTFAQSKLKEVSSKIGHMSHLVDVLMTHVNYESASLFALNKLLMEKGIQSVK